MCVALIPRPLKQFSGIGRPRHQSSWLFYVKCFIVLATSNVYQINVSLIFFYCAKNTWYRLRFVIQKCKIPNCFKNSKLVKGQHGRKCSWLHGSSHSQNPIQCTQILIHPQNHVKSCIKLSSGPVYKVYITHQLILCFSLGPPTRYLMYWCIVQHFL